MWTFGDAMGLIPDPRSGRACPALYIQPSLNMTQQLTVTIPQACKLTGLGRSTIYRLFDDGKLQRLKAGSRTLIKMDDLEAYIESLVSPSE